MLWFREAREREIDALLTSWWFGLDDASDLDDDSLYAWLGEVMYCGAM